METLYPIGNDQGATIINKLNDIAQALNIIKVNGVGGANATLSVTENTRTLLNQLFGDGVVVPINTRNYGDVLTVVDNSNHIDWETLPKQLPSYDSNNNSTDANKLLTVLNNGNLGWTQLSVGDTLPDYDNNNNSTDVNKVLTVLSNGTIDWESLPEQLPDYDNNNNSTDANKVLTVLSNGTIDWESLPEQLPSYDSNNNSIDANKVLTVLNNGTIDWESLPEQLPDYDNNNNSTDANKVLTVLSNGTIDWESLPEQLPSYTSSDRGKFLTIINTNNQLRTIWSNVFPYYDNHYDGEVLMVQNGNLTWTSLLPDYNNNDKGKALIIDDNDGLVWDNLLPPCSPSNDAGKVLIIDGHYGVVWDNLLPSYSPSNDTHKFLMVASNSNDSPTNLRWQSIEMLPSHSTYYDKGKVLTINNTGALAWKTLTNDGNEEEISNLPACNTENWLLINTSNGPEWKSPSDVQSLIVTQVQP